MGEVLSQSEIDNLLAALSSGELDTDELNGADDKQIKDYDFKRPTKFSREHLRTLEIIYEHYGRLLSTSMQVYLRKNIRQVEQKEAEDSEKTVSVWQYEEQELTAQEYESMILMQQVVSENTSGIVASVTQFQRDAVIDEYTEQLIEEGLI